MTGQVEGMTENGTSAFLGIPYAAPPTGKRRWAPPQMPQDWKGIHEAKAFGPACPQPVSQAVILADDTDQSEDCLTLNVWTPDTAAEGFPVMVWIHGGAFYLGAGGAPVYDGATLAREDVVVVTLNYRLGVLGFFGHPDLAHEQAGSPRTNYGFMDQVAALEWVRDNIDGFGGDPGNVTIFGESAGGISVLGHLYSPLSEGLFDKAIVQSGGGWKPMRNAADLDEDGAALADAFRVGTLKDLRDVPVNDLLAAQAESDTQWWPVIEENSLPFQISRAIRAGKIADVPLIIGTNSWEASLARARQTVPESIISMVPEGMREDARQAYEAEDLTRQQFADALYTDAGFAAPARWIAGKTAGGAPSYLYRFDQVRQGLDGKVPGAAHGIDVVYVFGTSDKLDTRDEFDETDTLMSSVMIDCWTGFAKTGKPGCGSAWPVYKPATDHLMVFDKGAANYEPDARTAQLNFQERLALRLALSGR